MIKHTQEELQVILRKHRAWLTGSSTDGSRAELSRADLRRADLRRAELRGANLTGANLYEANLYEGDLTGANLYEANLSGANLTGANLSGANLSGANLSGADLARVDLSGAAWPVGYHYLEIGPLGSRGDRLRIVLREGKLELRTGCFTGGLPEFERAVRSTHGDNRHGREYQASIAAIQAWAASRLAEDARAVESAAQGAEVH